MKNAKQCTKCGSNGIYRVEAVVGHTYGAGNAIPTGVIGIIKVNHRYVRRQCGFCGEWIHRQDLQMLKHRFPKY